MTAGETLLKITDIPFSYSFLAIIFGVMGVSFVGESIVLLVGAAGALGTFLSVTDPVGRLLQRWLKRGVNEIRKKENTNDIKWEFTIKAIKTRSIGIEIDKLVSMAYLVIVLGVFSTAITNYDSFAFNLQLYDDDQNVICDTFCIQGLGVLSTFMALIFVGLVGKHNWKELKQNVQVAGIHHLGIISEYVTSNTIENMSRAIEQNDWQTASEWAKIVENEIKTEKGKKDFNIEAARQIYRPLSVESMQIQATAQNIFDNNLNVTFPAAESSIVEDTALRLMITDENLINKIRLLYRKIMEYNTIPRTLEDQIKQIIQQEATKFYGMHVENVSYYFDRNGSGSSPSLWDCLRTGEHPTKRHLQPYVSRHIELQISSASSKPLKNQQALADFDKLWEKMLNRVKTETNVTKLKDKAREIQKINDELRPIYEERIRKQWV